MVDVIIPERIIVGDHEDLSVKKDGKVVRHLYRCKVETNVSPEDFQKFLDQAKEDALQKKSQEMFKRVCTRLLFVGGYWIARQDDGKTILIYGEGDEINGPDEDTYIVKVTLDSPIKATIYPNGSKRYGNIEVIEGHLVTCGLRSVGPRFDNGDSGT